MSNSLDELWSEVGKRATATALAMVTGSVGVLQWLVPLAFHNAASDNYVVDSHLFGAVVVAFLTTYGPIALTVLALLSSGARVAWAQFLLSATLLALATGWMTRNDWPPIAHGTVALVGIVLITASALPFGRTSLRSGVGYWRSVRSQESPFRRWAELAAGCLLLIAGVTAFRLAGAYHGDTASALAFCVDPSLTDHAAVYCSESRMHALVDSALREPDSLSAALLIGRSAASLLPDSTSRAITDSERDCVTHLARGEPCVQGATLAVEFVSPTSHTYFARGVLQRLADSLDACKASTLFGPRARATILGRELKSNATADSVAERSRRVCAHRLSLANYYQREVLRSADNTRDSLLRSARTIFATALNRLRLIIVDALAAAGVVVVLLLAIGWTATESVDDSFALIHPERNRALVERQRIVLASSLLVILALLVPTLQRFDEATVPIEEPANIFIGRQWSMPRMIDDHWDESSLRASDGHSDDDRTPPAPIDPVARGDTLRDIASALTRLELMIDELR